MRLISIFFIFLVFANASDTFITPTILKNSIDDSKTVIVDVGVKKLYDKSHIKNATYCDVSLFVNNINLYPQKINKHTLTLTSDKNIEKELRFLGINKNSKVIIYDHNTKDGIFKSTFLAFVMFYSGVKDVSILDGGYMSWIFENQDLISASPVINLLGDIDIKPKKELFVDSYLDNYKIVKNNYFNSYINRDYTFADKNKLRDLYKINYNISQNDAVIIDSDDIYKATFDWYILYKVLGYKKSKVYIK